jgi:hypothetical protein
MGCVRMAHTFYTMQKKGKVMNVPYTEAVVDEHCILVRDLQGIGTESSRCHDMGWDGE